jgi:biopolymer transport protein ExbB/TolQ
VIDSLTRVLSLISNALLIPVILALLGLMAWTLALLGGLLKELIERGRVRRGLEHGVAAAREHAGASRIWQALGESRSGLPNRFLQAAEAHAGDQATVNQVLARIEHDVADSVARHTFITRVSPMLGLMGTLIPLGPALSGLSSGDMSALGSNLVVAFTATVVGLLISGVAYGVGLLRRVWYSRDLTDLEFIATRLTP